MICVVHCSFASGRGDFASHMSEGLSTVAQVFDDLAKMRDPKLVNLHCLIVVASQKLKSSCLMQFHAKRLKF